MECRDTRKCCFRGSKASLNINPLECTALIETYEKDGQCPFCKEHYYDIASRSPDYKK